MNSDTTQKIKKISTTEAGLAIGMSRRWVVELIKKGEIEAIQPGERKFLVLVESLKKYLEKKGLQDIAKSLDEKILEIRKK